MKFQNTKKKRILSCILVVVIVGGLLPNGLLSSLFGLFTPLFVNAESGYNVPEYEYINQLYDGSDAISPLPTYEEYKAQTGYTESKRISLTDFREKFGEGLSFNNISAKNYMSQGYKLMICDAEELYLYSQIVNSKGSSPTEVSFYLSANIVLGDNIEYTEMSYNNNYFLPIGNDSNPFTGTFDGQGFEIRDLYFDAEYTPATIGFFGVVGSSAVVKNFGIYHPTIDSTISAATFTAVIASRNYGTIDDVYAIAQEFQPESGAIAIVNVVKSANSTAGGLVAINYASGTITDSYFAGMLDAREPIVQNPICPVNNGGTISNCYYDKELFAVGTTPNQIDNPDDENIIGLTNIQLKKMEGMTNTEFKLVCNYPTIRTDKNSAYWQYPRIYGFLGAGTENDPLLISTPAQLIQFPNSIEYVQKVYFKIDRCIDMNEIAPNAYKPKLDATFISNYKSGNRWVEYNFNSNNTNVYNRSFYGKLIGTADDGDDNCPIHHTASLGNDNSGNKLRETHIILNLTIDTPASSVNSKDKRYSALIAQSASDKNSQYNSAVKDLSFIGGEISSGDTDCMPSTNTDSSYNVRSATVIGYSSYSDMENVHSSATVKLGTGLQRSVTMGGIMGGGAFHFITDCTNSGDIIGGALNMASDNITTYNVLIGGLLGSAGTAANTQWSWHGKLTHVANYGNVYGAYMITDEANDWKLTGGIFAASGITTSNAGSSATGNTTENGSNPTIYISDSNRMSKVANFGNIYDVPVLKDKVTGEVIYEDRKPIAEALPSGKKIVINYSFGARSRLFGIGGNIVSNAYNEGNFYSVAVNKCEISGIGCMGSAPDTSKGQYYNLKNYNKGNIYMYVGGVGAYGISIGYTYYSYNCGNIYLYDGIIFSNQGGARSYDNGGAFTGICGMDTKYSYNIGNIYIAPSARQRFNLTTTSTDGSAYILTAGCSIRYSEHSISAGEITVDLNKNNFDPTYATSNTTNSNHFPLFSMSGTGIGSYNAGYSKYNFIPNKKDNSRMTRLYVYGCCTGILGSDWRNNMNYNRNYSDITIDTTEAPNNLDRLLISGIGYNKTEDENDQNANRFTFNNNINYGNFTVKGLSTGSVIINLLGDQALLAENNLNLGDVNIDKDCVIGGLNIRCYYTQNNTTKRRATIKNMVNGWYDGCELPSSMQTDEWNNEVFSKLDKSRRYGKITVSGTLLYNSYITGVLDANVSGVSYAKDTENIINNGEITLTDLEIINSHLNVRGVGVPYCRSSKNYAPITLKNIYHNFNSVDYTTIIDGCAGGDNNINYAPITVENCITNARYGNSGLYVAGISCNYAAHHCENRGDITVKNLDTATVHGTEYTSDALTVGSRYNDSIINIGGIKTNAGTQTDYCVNYGDISVERIGRYNIGGIAGYFRNNEYAIDNCINYGDININESGGSGYVGGIAAQLNPGTASHCYNFANIRITNPTSYVNTGDYIGGIAGYVTSNGTITQSENFGNIYYNNDKPYNTNNTKDNTRASSMSIGGIAGKTDYYNINCVLNYGNIDIGTERNRNSIVVGGITGRSENWGNAIIRNNYNMINYGNITVSYLQGNGLNAGGIVGRPCPNNSTNGGPAYVNGINYGTVQYKGDNKTGNYVGSLVGYNAYATPLYLDKLVDLSDPPEGVTDYPIIGGYWDQGGKNKDGLTLYSKNEATVNSHDQSRGTLKLVTLDKNETTGLYNTAFPFREEIIHSLTDYKTYQENGMVYQDYTNLSPYLQAYMKMRFGDEAEKYGAYVVMDKTFNECRDVDEFMPRMSKVDSAYSFYQFGLLYDRDKPETSACFDSSLVNDNELNALYSTIVSPSERTLQKDFDIYAQQISKSSLAEILEYRMATKWQYTNKETRHFQFFHEYTHDIETHAATLSDGTVSDTIKYTDINVYMSIDDINSYIAQRKVRNPETGKPVTEKDDEGVEHIVYETIDTGGYLYISSDIEHMSDYSKMVFYQGDTMKETKRLDKMNHYTDPYPKGDDIWLTADNLEEMLADETVGWSNSLGSYSAKQMLNDTEDDIANRDMWEIKIPYQSEKDLENMYTKVLGVITAEDGIHKNIVVVHVVIDRYKPYATLDSVTLNTTKDGLVTSTVDNGGLEIDPDMKDSLTDKDNDDPEKPAQDVTHYSVSDNYQKEDGSSLSGENIQTYKVYANTSTNNNYPMITITTHNMDEEDEIYARVLWQDRLPSAEGTTYNKLKWNYESEHYKDSYTTNPVDVVYAEDQTSTGKATINLDGLKYDSAAFYGGFYKVDLYYERTKSSGSSKHFATVFLCKEHSPMNTIRSTTWSPHGWGKWNANPTSVTGTTLKNFVLQTTYDAEYGLSAEGYQQGYLLNSRSNYNIDPLVYFYCTKEDNDKTRDTVNSNNSGSYMSLKAYSSDLQSSTYYVDTDNPIYNDNDEETPKGKAVTLENEIEKIYVKSDSETGAYYPIKYFGHTDIMAENGDIRRYTYEQSHTGDMGQNDSWITYNNDPTIIISSATKNGFSIIKKDENGSYIGEILGKDESDTTFYTVWNGSNVTGMYRNDNDIYKNDKYIGSGYASDRIKIYFKDISSDNYIELTTEQINKYFSKIDVGTSNNWTFVLQNDAPVGTYKLVPYFQYRMNFTNTVVGSNLIKLYDYETKAYLEGKDALNFTWRIPYSVPFIIENIPNDESYITEFNLSNQQCTPFIVEKSDIEGSESREVSIINASGNGKIIYKGYDDVMTGDNRVDTFNIYSYVKKDSQTSNIKMRVPYKATLQKYTGTVLEDDSYPSFDDSLWESADAEEVLIYDEEGNVVANDYKQYSFSVTYNEYDDTVGDYTYSPSITYYKAIAEDGKTETLYKVYVVPGVRNKSTTLEIAQSSEVENLGGEESFKQEMKEIFDESDKLYQEILDKYGIISATIKELNGSDVDAYQSKYFNKPTSGESEPYVYNLKSFAYDISIDLPAGYTYDVLVFSKNMDSADTLKNSQNGFDGKQLILSSSSKQDLNIRIVIKRDTAMTIWGVQYIWNMSNAVKDDNNLAILGKGGIFSNYVYTLPKNS